MMSDNRVSDIPLIDYELLSTFANDYEFNSTVLIIPESQKQTKSSLTLFVTNEVIINKI